MRFLSSEDFREVWSKKVLCRVYRELDEHNKTSGFSWEIRAPGSNDILVSGREQVQRHAWLEINNHIGRMRKEKQYK